MQKHQQRSQPAGQRLGPRDPTPPIATLLHHKAGDVRRAQLAQRDVDRVREFVEEQPRDPLAQGDRSRHQSPLIDQILAVLRDQTLNRRVSHRRLRHDTNTAEISQQLVQSPGAAQVRVRLTPDPSELLDHIATER